MMRWVLIALCLGLAVTLGCGADRVEAPPSETGKFLSDSAITTKVKTALLAERSLNALPIEVETHDGVVRLSGMVGNADQVQQALEVARRIKGVNEVRNEMRLQGGAPAS